ncbi:dihydrolipoamide dehydrogenase [Natronoarchaeum philippinense]|uniref:Dihydrolipoamide dehydrogenase n=1 Tax=Natronoarchaeum philippinense TaxID=558529 RepID=A0A285N2Q2_NATPI|nr:dihydrolipoyl dehydrogenase [Natronoarchaeum philippinense]SNZ03223.1 dihydrolipoamide dehydrogenase [Natronoarchaeum philippinense]
MQEFDLVVIGGGSGTAVGDAAADRGQSVAIVEPGPLGGACVTRGCVPSKGLIHRADIVETIRSAGEFGVDASVDGVTFEAIVEEVHDTVHEKAEHMEQSVEASDRKTLFDAEARFVDERTVAVDGEKLRGEQVVIAAGGRPSTPPIDGLDAVDHLTSTGALFPDERPDRLVILGGGYIGAELGHFYEAMGVDVAIVGRSDALLDREDDAVSEAVTTAFEERCDVYTGHEATAVEDDGEEITVTAERTADGETVEVTGDELLLATGRRPNTDRLAVEEAGIKTDDDGFVETDEYLRTTADGVWAVGDIAGPPLFKHVADYEARIVAENAVLGREEAVDYTGVGHAVFTSPRVASVGETEAELRDTDTAYESARAEYGDVPMGMAAKEDRGFVKVLAAPDDGEILGCHIVGDEAPTLLHEVLVALRSGSGTVADVAETIHVHPALNEVVLAAFDELADVPYSGTPDWSDVSMGSR